MIPDIVDLMVELSKEQKTGSPVRDLYAVYREVAMEVGRRLKQLAKEKKDEQSRICNRS